MECRFCQNPESIITKRTCCTGCLKLEAALHLIDLLNRCKCKLCKDEIKRLEEKHEID